MIAHRPPPASRAIPLRRSTRASPESAATWRWNTDCAGFLSEPERRLNWSDGTRGQLAANVMLFYLGTNQPQWLRQINVPLFVSHIALRRYKTLPRSVGRWALDSGGFTQLSTHGRWEVTPREYVDAARRYRDEIGNLDWASQQDWMCEPFITAKTGLTIREHQQRTIDNLLELRAIEPDIPWIPVIQGWKLPDYLDHVEQWDKAGVDLRNEPVVGLGSVCRRQAMGEAVEIVSSLADLDLRIHGFGFKMSGLRAIGNLMHSADSMAWSYNARRNPPLPGHEHRHKACTTCIEWAMQWRERALNAIGFRPYQRSFEW